MELLFFCPRWGSEQLSPETFVQKVKQAGYDGVEMSLPADSREKALWNDLLRDHALLLIAQQWEAMTEPVFEKHAALFERMLRNAASLQPLFINSQTGKDSFTFSQNAQLIEKAASLEKETGVRILHEIHRGKFSYHPAVTLSYLEKYPSLSLTADLSHWCCVTESYLGEHGDALQAALEHTHHIHTRVGFPEGPQVNDPRAPEWKDAVEAHLQWWDDVVYRRQRAGDRSFTFTAEFGPPPYLPVSPYTQQPLAGQWEVNVYMMQLLKERYAAF